jgi:hypothetical protein
MPAAELRNHIQTQPQAKGMRENFCALGNAKKPKSLG